MTYSDEQNDKDTREALRLALQLMTARTHDDLTAVGSTVQAIADFISEDEELVAERLSAYVNANGFLAAFFIDTLGKALDRPREETLKFVASTISQRTDDDEAYDLSTKDAGR